MQNVLEVHHGFETLVKDVHNHLYANANLRTNEAIATEVGKILLALGHASRGGRLDALADDDRIAALKADARVSERLAAEVALLFSAMNDDLRRYPPDAEIALDAQSTAYVRARFDGLLFTEVDRDWLGDAMEVFRSLDAKRLGGQFFTDQRVTDLAVRLLRFDPSADDDFLDICAGTGGFLLAAARELARNHADWSVDSVVGGIEVDPHLAQVANGSIALVGESRGAVQVADSLAHPESWPVALRKRVVPGTHRCLASNPPFGQKITVKDEAILGQYELARRWSRTDDGWVMARSLTRRPPDILFVERNLSLLEPGKGRLALVTPYQILSGPQLGFVREWILRNARVLAIVDLPADTFQPWTGTKTSLMVLERRPAPLERWEPSLDGDHHIFMAVSDHIGHDRRGKPVLTSDGQILTDLPAVAVAYEEFALNHKGEFTHPRSAAVPAASITRENDLRLNAAFYQPAAATTKQRVTDIGRSPGWSETTVGEVCERIFFPTRFKRDYVPAGPDAVPFLGGSQISQLIPTTEKYLSRDARNLADLVVEPGWLLVTRSGSTGIVSSVPDGWAGYAMSEHIIRVVPDETKIDPLYLEAYLRSSVGQELLATGIFGSVIDEITPEHIGSIPIPVPTSDNRASEVGAWMTEARKARDVAIRGLTNAVATIDQLISEFEKVATD